MHAEEMRPLNDPTCKNNSKSLQKLKRTFRRGVVPPFAAPSFAVVMSRVSPIVEDTWPEAMAALNQGTILECKDRFRLNQCSRATQASRPLGRRWRQRSHGHSFPARLRRDVETPFLCRDSRDFPSPPRRTTRPGATEATAVLVVN